jgi:serine/threonine protein kinase
MEFFEDGDMDKLIKTKFDSNQIFTEMELLEMMVQLASGVEYLHNMGLMHRDLKPGNVFVKKLGDKARLVIGDFGLARQMESSMANTVAGVS